MGARPKIIEFYGLPGCGKTTLCNKLKEIYEKKGYKVGVLPDAANRFSWLSLFYILSFSDCLFLYKFYRCFIKRRVCKNLVLSPVRRLLIYKCAKRKKEYDYLFIDHGAVQSIVRALYDVPYPFDFICTSVVKDYYRKISADFYVCCNISTDEAFARVRFRNRKNSGTFDQYPDEQLNNVLKGHNAIFIKTKEVLEELNKCLLEIDSTDSVEKCISQIEDFLI